MPQAVPAFIVNTVKYALSIGASKVIMALAGTLPAIFLRQRQLKKEAAAARRAALDRIQDRTLSFPVDNTPWRFILGRDVKVGCGIYPVGTSGPRQEFFHVIAVAANHEISAIKRIFIGDYELLTDGVGMANAGRFFLANPRPQEHIATANGSGQVVLPTPPIENPVRWVTAAGRFSVGGSSPVSGSTVSGLTPGTQYKFTYRTNQGSGTPVVSVTKYLGTTTQPADPLLTAELGAGVWPVTAQGKGVAYLRLTFSYNPDIFPNGIENITVIADGPAVFDPRTSTTVLTDNIALLMRHVWTAPDLGNRPSSLVDDASVIAAANACDEQVQISASPATFQARYFGAGTFTDDTDLVSVLDSLAEGMAGGYCIQARKLVLRAGVYQAPTLPALTEDDLAEGALELTTTQPRAQLFNAVTARFNDPARNWEEASVSPVTDSTFATQDGGQIWADAGSLPWTKNNIAGQRLLRVQLNQARQAVGLTANFNMNAYPITPGDRVPLNMPTFGWANKVFLCKKRSFSPAGAVRLTLVEDGASVYAWNLGQAVPYDPLPNSNLPLPYTVAAPASLTLASGNAELLQLQDGTVVPRLRISWPRSTDPNVLAGGQVQVEWMRADQTLDAVTGYPGKTEPLVGDAVETLLQSVEEGFVYLVRVRFRNGLGIYSPWIYSDPHKVLGKSDPPPDATSLTVVAQPSGVRRFTISLPATLPLDIAGAQIRYQAGASITWATAAKLQQSISVQQARDAGGFVGFERNDPGPGQWTFEVRLLDGSGNVSPSGVRTTVTLGMGPRVYRVAAVGGSAVAPPVASALVVDGVTNSAGARSYTMHRIRRSDGVVEFTQTYDVFGAGALDGRTAATLAADLNATSAAYIVVVRSHDEPRDNRLASGLPEAMYRCGASRAVFGSTRFRRSSAYVLVGIPGCGENNGAEAYQGASDNDANAWVDVSFQIQDGNLLGVSGNYTPTSLTDYGYTGDLNATADISLQPFDAIAFVSGNTLTKSPTASGAWNCAAWTRDRFVNGAAAYAQLVQPFVSVGFGLDAAPSASADFADVDYWLYVQADGVTQAFESGVATTLTPSAAGDSLAVTYDGSVVRYLRNGQVLRTVTAPAGLSLGLRANVASPGGSIGGLRLTAYGNPSALQPNNPLSPSNVINYVNPNTINTREINPGAVTVVSDTKPANQTLSHGTNNATATLNIATLSYANTSGETQQVLVNYYALHEAFVGITGLSVGTFTCSSAVRVSGVTYTGQPSEFLELAQGTTTPPTGAVEETKPHGGAFVVAVPAGSTMTVNYETKIVNNGTDCLSTITSKGISMSLAVLKR